MYKALILSDNHGKEKELATIINNHQDVHLKIHCGDSELSAHSAYLKDFVAVRGNCDFDDRFPLEEVIDLHGIRFLISHGHLYNIKSSLLQLQYRALEVEANIVCFGHSHIAYFDKHHNQTFVNPGSIHSPRDGREPTYCIVSWKDNGEIKVQYYYLNGEKVPFIPSED